MEGINENEYDFCCEKCFDESEIIKYIYSKKSIGDCSYCGSSNVHVIDVYDLGQFIRVAINRAYENLEGGTGAMADREEQVYLDRRGRETTGESIYEILVENESIFSSNIDYNALIEDLFSYTSSMDDMQLGYSDIYSDGLVFRDDLYGVETNGQYNNWEVFKHITKYYNRYFDVNESNRSRDQLLNEVASIFQFMEEVLEKGSNLYRARSMSTTEEKFLTMDYYKEVSPAPPVFTKPNRMSPKGISYTYLSSEETTCFLETGLKNGDTTLIASFETKRDLKVLDLTKNSNIRIKNSIFSDEYKHDLNWTNDFVILFSNEISKPINDDDKLLEYVPTQVMAEYIRKLGYDGIKFKSSMADNAYNYVLFCGPNKEISREYYSYLDDFFTIPKLVYFTHWLKLNSVEYAFFECNVKNNLEIMKKVLFSSRDIKRNDLKLSNFGSISFDNFEEAEYCIIELNKKLRNNYITLINGVDFCLEDYIKQLTKNHPKDEHMLSTYTTFGLIEIQIDDKDFRFEEKEAKKKFNELLYRK